MQGSVRINVINAKPAQSCECAKVPARGVACWINGKSFASASSSVTIPTPISCDLPRHQHIDQEEKRSKMPFATVNGHAIQYVESGQVGYNVQEDKLPIVCIHGLGSSQNYYMPVVPYLEGHRVVALTTYGAAESKSKGEKLSLVDMAEDVISLMDHLEIPKAIVAGHSMGGPMALTVAARHPDRVAGVVAIGPVNPSSIKAEMFTARIETVTKGMHCKPAWNFPELRADRL